MAEIKDFSTTDGSNSSASPEGAPENMAPAGVNNTIRANMGKIARWYEDVSGVNSTAGTQPAYTLAASRTISALAIGDAYLVRCHSTLTGILGATLAVDGLTAKAIVTTNQVALSAGQMIVNGIYHIVYDATNDTYQILNPAVPALGTAFHVTLGGTETANFTVATPEVVKWTTQVRNDGDYFQLSGDTSPIASGENGFVVPVTGWYSFSASCRAKTAIADTKFCRTFLYVDPLGIGSPAKEIGGSLVRTGFASAMSSVISVQLYCTATDVVQVFWRWEGSSTNAVHGDTKDSFFSGVRIA